MSLASNLYMYFFSLFFFLLLFFITYSRSVLSLHILTVLQIVSNQAVLCSISGVSRKCLRSSFKSSVTLITFLAL